MKKTAMIPPLVALLASLALAQKEVPLPKDLPAYGAEKPLQTPAVKSATLDNGLTVWLVSKPGLPKVAVSIAVRGGFAADPADRPGISELLAKTIDQGTRTRTAKQIAQDLQAAGGDLSASPNKDSMEISTSILSPKADTALGVLADIVQNASFPESEVSLAKTNLADSLEQREAEPQFLASRARDKILFKDHPYHVTAPTKESVAAATPADLRDIFTQRFRPDQAVLVAVGDFENEKMMDAVKKAFGSWKAPSKPALGPTPNPPAGVEHAVYIVPRPGSVQTTIELAAFGPKRGDPDFESAEVANAVCGGTFSSRLVSNIREDKGYTYSPYAFIRSLRVTGVLVTHADVRNEVTGASFNEMQYELNRLTTTSPTDEELLKAQRYLVGSEAVRLQDRASLAGLLTTLWVSGLQPEEIGRHGQKITSTTIADVNAAARKYFPAHQAAIIAVGEDKVVREEFAPFGLPVRTVP